MATTVRINLLGSFYTLRKSRGLSPCVDFPLERGTAALDVARAIDLPLERIAAVYRNHVCIDPRDPVDPGDRLAFVPWDVPGPHRGLKGFPPPDRS